MDTKHHTGIRLGNYAVENLLGRGGVRSTLRRFLVKSFNKEHITAKPAVYHRSKRIIVAGSPGEVLFFFPLSASLRFKMVSNL